jgi:hypothetical protein
MLGNDLVVYYAQLMEDIKKAVMDSTSPSFDDILLECPTYEKDIENLQIIFDFINSIYNSLQNIYIDCWLNNENSI